MSSASPNKRKYPRVEGKGVAAYLRLNGHNAGCTVENISVGGVFVRTDRFLPVGTKLAFDLVKPGMKKALTVSGWIVGVITPELSARTKLPQGLRIQFAKMNPLATDALQELVGSLRRNNAEPPVLYPVEDRAAARPKRASGARRALRPPAAAAGPARLEPASARRGAVGAAPRSPSRALGDEPAMNTEVEMEAAGSPAGEEPSMVRRWFQEGDEEEATHDGRGLFSGRRGAGEERGRGGSGMEDDGLLDSFPEEAANQFQADVRAAERANARGRGEDDDEDGGASVTDREDPDDPPMDATRPRARYGQAAAPRAGGRGEEGAGESAEDLLATNQELQRLLDRREQEIAALRSQLSKTESQLREKEEQLQLAKRVLKSNGLG